MSMTPRAPGRLRGRLGLVVAAVSMPLMLTACAEDAEPNDKPPVVEDEPVEKPADGDE